VERDGTHDQQSTKTLFSKPHNLLLSEMRTLTELGSLLLNLKEWDAKLVKNFMAALKNS
jgi:hypothetical protein